MRLPPGAGAERTPFPDALHVCPGDEDLEHVLSAGQLVDALGATFGIVDRVLETWTLGMLDGVVRRTLGAEDRIRTQGSVIQRVSAHDVYHIAEVNEILARRGAPLIDLWV